MKRAPERLCSISLHLNRNTSSPVKTPSLENKEAMLNRHRFQMMIMKTTRFQTYFLYTLLSSL